MHLQLLLIQKKTEQLAKAYIYRGYRFNLKSLEKRPKKRLVVPHVANVLHLLS